MKFVSDRQKKRDSKAEDKEAESPDEEGDTSMMDTVERKKLKNVKKTIRYQQKHQRIYRQKEPKLKNGDE